MLHRNLTQVLSSWYILLLLAWEALPRSLSLWGKKETILHQFFSYPSASSDFCEFPCGIFTGEGAKVWYMSQSCLAGLVPTLDVWESSKGRGYFVVSVWGETCSSWGKAEIRAVICQVHENSTHWSCFRNLFISTCVGTVSQAGFCLSNGLLVS